jgi:hypothetical protein
MDAAATVTALKIAMLEITLTCSVSTLGKHIRKVGIMLMSL